MTASPEDDRLEYARRLIASRCPELDPADLAALAEAAPDPNALPGSISEQILDAIGHMMDRLDRIERAVRVEA
jgi:hypothetical protein